jgi:hypothetical protein
MELEAFKAGAQKLGVDLDFASKGHGDESLKVAYQKLLEQPNEDDSKRVPVQATPAKQNLQVAEREETISGEEVGSADAGIELPVFHRWITKHLETLER